LGATVDSLTNLVKMGAQVGLLIFGTWEVLQHSFSAGDMLAINSLAYNFLTPLAGLVSTAMQFQLIGSYLDRLNDVLQTPPEQDRGKVKQAPPLKGEVVLDRVSFRYGVLAPLVVDDVSVAVRPGQFVAVVGKSGAGKSTLAHLFLGLYVPVTGKISYDGMDLRELDLRSLRRQVGIVTQHHDLMGGTIRDNIALGDLSLTLDQIVEAARLAHIHDEIAAMPLGYATPLVDRGASLSGGQRQRLALARALVHKPAILLLDEATSALDAVTEARVQQALAALRCTRIVIAHRLSTVVSADLILVMRDGKIAEAGTHHELLLQHGVYEELTHSQLQGLQATAW
jgi:ATP-binding cassette subfamily B protein